MVELIGNERKNRVLARDLEDGQIAIIIEDGSYTDRIVQRFGTDLISIGLRKGQHWSNADVVTLEVRILEDGESIRIKDNN